MDRTLLQMCFQLQIADYVRSHLQNPQETLYGSLGPTTSQNTYGSHQKAWEVSEKISQVTETELSWNGCRAILMSVLCYMFSQSSHYTPLDLSIARPCTDIYIVRCSIAFKTNSEACFVHHQYSVCILPPSSKAFDSISVPNIPLARRLYWDVKDNVTHETCQTV